MTVVIDGLVEREKSLGIDDLLGKVRLEERLYRHRCVRAGDGGPGSAFR